MSRVHEALKRAATPATSDLRVVSTAPAISIEHFPQEEEPRAGSSAELPSRAPRDPVRPPHSEAPDASATAAHTRAAETTPNVVPAAVTVQLVGAATLRHRGKLVCADAPAAALEEYGGLASTLRDLQRRSEWVGPGGVDRGVKALSITSAAPAEGKTLTAVNLALTLSEVQRVLLIDASVTRPSVHEVLGLSNGNGLSDLVRSERERVPLQQVSGNLAVLTAGRPLADAAAVLDSDRMRALLTELGQQFEWVLLDSPSISTLPDARLVARLTRAVLLVIGAGQTRQATVDRAVGRLGRDCVLGAVLNKVCD